MFFDADEPFILEAPRRNSRSPCANWSREDTLQAMPNSFTTPPPVVDVERSTRGRSKSGSFHPPAPQTTYINYTTGKGSVSEELGDDETQRISALIAEQEAEFGVNMYDALLDSDEPLLQEYISYGMTVDEALLKLFEGKGFTSVKKRAHVPQAHPVSLPVPQGFSPPYYSTQYPSYQQPYPVHGMQNSWDMNAHVEFVDEFGNPVDLDVGDPYESDEDLPRLRQQNNLYRHPGGQSLSWYPSPPHQHHYPEQQNNPTLFTSKSWSANSAYSANPASATTKTLTKSPTSQTSVGGGSEATTPESLPRGIKKTNSFKAFFGIGSKVKLEKTKEEKALQKKLKYKDADVITLMDMGFSREQAVQALVESQNNLTIATNSLLLSTR